MGLANLKDKLSYQTLLLGSAVLLTTGALAFADWLTREPIQKAQLKDLKNSLVQVLPMAYDNDLLQDTVKLAGPNEETLTVYRARQKGQIKAVVFRVTGQGYAGPVVLVMGVDERSHLLGVRVIKHRETPGLGDKIDAAKSNWILTFEGKSLADPPAAQWQVKKDGGVFDQFAGATITPRAVVQAVKQGLRFFAAHRDAFFTTDKGK